MLAGLAILGTLLTSVAIARGRLLRQWAEADKRLRAAQSANAMLARWLASPSAMVPVPGDGPLDGAAGFVWRTVALRDPSAAKLGAVIVRFQVFEPGGSEKAPILIIEFLRHESPKLPHAAANSPVPSQLGKSIK